MARLRPEVRPLRAAVVVLAGGSGSRVGARRDGAPVNKVYLDLAGRPVIAWSLDAAARVPGVVRLVLVARPEDGALTAAVRRAHTSALPVELVPGGTTRHESEQAALDHLAPAVAAEQLDVVAIHDGARPLAGTELFGRVLRAAAEEGGAVPVVPAGPLLPVPGSGLDAATLRARGEQVRVQTPQAFRAAELVEAYRAAARAGSQGTDTAATVAAHSTLRVVTVAGAMANLKITYPDDVAVAEALLAASSASA